MDVGPEARDGRRKDTFDVRVSADTRGKEEGRSLTKVTFYVELTFRSAESGVISPGGKVDLTDARRGRVRGKDDGPA